MAVNHKVPGSIPGDTVLLSFQFEVDEGTTKANCGRVAQMVERLLSMQEAAGSMPASSNPFNFALLDDAETFLL